MVSWLGTHTTLTPEFLFQHPQGVGSQLPVTLTPGDTDTLASRHVHTHTHSQFINNKNEVIFMCTFLEMSSYMQILRTQPAGQ